MEASEETSEISQRDALMDDGASQSTRINPGGFDVNKFQTLIGNIPNDFEAWASLVTHIEQTYPNDIERIILIYDAFLFEYPLCYGYWNKYANHKARLCSLHEVEETYERAVQAAPYSVDIWVSYSSFGALTYEDPAGIRSLYERGLSFVKKDYLCHQLWDKYIEFEYCFKQWIQLAHLYIRTLMFPSKQLQSYYERFKRLVDIWSEEMVCQNDLELQREIIPYDHGMIDIMDSEYAEISNLIKEFVDKKGILSTAAFRKYLRIGEQFYHKSSQLDEKISCFEAKIRRSYFHVKPLDAGQLKNWHCYLDFVERQGDFDWTVKLYERCLIACANYSEFWIRYVEFVDTKGGREIANHALARALTVFLKRVPAFHVYSSMFKEKIGDVSGARALSLQYNIDLAYGFLEAVTREANMEKRMGNIGRAYLVYEKAIELAKESGYLDVVPKLYCNFAQFTFVASGSINAARAVFIKGVQQSPCKLILEGLIHFTAIHGGASEIPILDTIIADAIKPDSKVFQALSPQDREGISRSFLEFVDLHGNIHEIMKAWDRHRKAFPHIMKEECSLNKRGNRYDKATVLPCNGWLNNCSPAPVQQIKQLPTQSCDDTLSEMDVTGSRHMEKSNNGVKVIEEHLNDAKLQEQDVEEHSRPRHVADEQEHGTPDVNVKPKIENIGEPRHSSDVNVKPPSFDNLSMNSPVTESQQVTSKTSLSPELHEEVITIPSSIEIPDTQHVISTSEVHEPVTVDTKSCTSSQADLQNEESRIYQPTESHATVAQSKFQQKLNAQSNYDLKRDLTASVASPKIASGGSRAQMNLGKKLSENATSSHCHTQMSQPQQWPVHAQVQYSSSGTSSQILMDQSQPHQSQIWPGTQTQQTNQTQLLYQMAAAQAYQTANFAWAGQSMQNQSVVFVQPQPSPQPTSQAQTLGYQQLHLNNEQYGHPQSGQVITPDIWYYYQQQLYYLQQQQQQEQQQQQQQEQQQQNQLMHNVSEQPPQTSQSGEVQQQPEKHSQWLPMQNQQLLIQQQKQENQQSNQEEPQVHASTPEKNQNQPQQQQQASQLHQQSEQANQAQQEQLLYLQQQQQMYLHQQQQLYLQQILQHQFLQQQQQQAPQQQFQQQQTLQQHQQQLLFQQQQLFQVQQMQQEQQQRVGGSEVQVQPTNYIQGEESTSQKVDQPMRSSSSTPQRTPTKQ